MLELKYHIGPQNDSGRDREEQPNEVSVIKLMDGRHQLHSPRNQSHDQAQNDRSRRKGFRSTPTKRRAEFFGRSNALRELFLVHCERTKIALHLNTMPKRFRLLEESTKADGHRRSNCAFSKNNLIHRPGRNPDCPGHGILGNPQRLEVFLQQDLTRSHRRVHLWCGHSATSSSA
jgi:hypothetical protein